MFSELTDEELSWLHRKMWRGAFIFCDEDIPLDNGTHLEVLAIYSLADAEKLWRAAGVAEGWG